MSVVLGQPQRQRRRRMLRPLRRGCLVAAAVLVAGCGGGGRSSGATVSTMSGPFEQLTSGWRTDFTRHSVPISEITFGGPPKDGIPAIDRPRFVPAPDVTFLGPREPVLSVEIAGQARAYPMQILIWHEIVNDTLAETPITVTFCPLCNTALVFDRRVGSRTLDFGTTGNLRNSDLVMYDRQTESWWQQFGGEGIVGQLTGTLLKRVPSRILAFADFRNQFPNGTVLSRDTGFDRPYGQNPYVGYDAKGSPQLFGSRNSDDRRLDPKERVVLVQVGAESAAVPFEVLAERRVISFELAGTRLEVRWRPGIASALDSERIAAGKDIGAAEVRDASGRLVPFEEPFWFAVAAFRPDVVIIRR